MRPLNVNKNISLAFPTIVFQRLVSDRDELNPPIKRAILEQEKMDGGANLSNMGGWHSKADFFKWQGPAIATLRHRILSAITEVTAFDTERDPKDIRIEVNMYAWANVNRHGDYNRIHVHPMSNWSGVYYVEVGSENPDRPTSGLLEFLDPRNRPQMFQTPAVGSMDFLGIKPATGLLVLFPSWLYHTVHPYFGTGERISISFNSQVRKIHDLRQAPERKAPEGD